jgi:poly(3-hydroxybutyrate) depolymerase/tRNA A-37 threonylcarbamoyl transferase component Bud32
LTTTRQGDDDPERPESGWEGTATVSAAPRAEGAFSTAPPATTPEPSHASARSTNRAALPPELSYPTIPGYEILGRLGQGGMGQVFKARADTTDRIIALKIIRSDRQEDVQLIRRFQREAKAGRRLDHPNIVAFYDAHEIENFCFLTMEYVEGSDLAQLLEQTSGPMPVPLACDCARQAALGLQHAHARGLIHRDIKPSNLLMTKSGDVVKILDMGLARLGACPDTGHAESELTHSGVMMGTPAYMAPEQVFDARNVDGRADIYSLGCTLYHLLAGRPPHRHQMKEPPPVDWVRSDVSPILAAVVRQMMARMPEDRYPAAADVVRALTPFCHGRTNVTQWDDDADVEALVPRKANATGPSRMLQRLVWLALAGAVLLVGLALIGLARSRAADAASGKAGEFASETVQVGGVTREYRLVVPKSVDLSKPAPLVIAFHGMFIDSKDFMPKYTKLNDTAAKHQFILAYPEAIGKSWGLSPEKVKDDLAFFDALVAKLTTDYKIDADRLYVLGMSNGGYFAHLVAKERSKTVAAVASHSGPLGLQTLLGVNAERKFPVLIIHGEKDRILSVNFARENRDKYKREGHEVKYVEVHGMDHVWATKVDINETIWEFFAEHPRNKK